MGDLLPVLQALSTPVLLAMGWLASRGVSALHRIDRRLVRVETHLGIGVNNEEST